MYVYISSLSSALLKNVPGLAVHFFVFLKHTHTFSYMHTSRRSRRRRSRRCLSGQKTTRPSHQRSTQARAGGGGGGIVDRASGSSASYAAEAEGKGQTSAS